MLRPPRQILSSGYAKRFGNSKLTLAHLIVLLENIVTVFARPLLIAGFFIALAWFGLFTGLYPWAHLVALILFTAFFCDACGRAHIKWKPLSSSVGRRRLELSNNLAHRPLDVLEDSPANLDEETRILWQIHVDQTRNQLKDLKWPKWLLNCSDTDPYALRHAMLFTLILSVIVGWGALGGRLVQAINPALDKLHSYSPTMDAWITPPEYTGLPPIMIATPAGLRRDSDVLNIPEGSLISAHLLEKDGLAPSLQVNNDTIEFTKDNHGDFEVSAAIQEGQTISIKRGWQEIGSWKIHLVKDQPPSVSFSEAPSVSEQKSIRLSYKASDDYGVTAVKVEITPRESVPGVSNEPLIMDLLTSSTKELKRIAFEDLTASPWSGLPVDIKLKAYDAAGHEVLSDTKQIILPERQFFHPIARTLAEERKKLLQSPFDDNIRNEVANVMAGIAQKPANYRADPVVLMALRSGAVRLVLSRGENIVTPIAEILWQSALRIEDGTMGEAEQDLKRAQKELADALDRGANQVEISQLIDRLHQALGRFLAELSTRMAAQPGPIEDLGALTGEKSNSITPQDLERMLEQMRDLSATGQREGARQQLSKLEQLLQSLQTSSPQLSEAQKNELQSLKRVREIKNSQKGLMDKTFQRAQSPLAQENLKLAAEQNEIEKQLGELLANPKNNAMSELHKSQQAMTGAEGQLRQGAPRQALDGQGKALKELEMAEKSMADELRQSMLVLKGMPSFGQGGGNNSFGDKTGFGAMADDGGIHLPDHMQTRRVREILDELQKRAGDLGRSKPERDYLDRLLRNF